MWIFSTEGFLSIVEPTDRDFKDCLATRNVPMKDRKPSTAKTKSKYLLVRARFHADLKPFNGLAEYSFISQHTDYPFRAFVERTLVKRVVADMLSDLNYRNFKNACKKREEERPRKETAAWIRALGRVWSVLFEAADPFRFKG